MEDQLLRQTEASFATHELSDDEIDAVTGGKYHYYFANAYPYPGQPGRYMLISFEAHDLKRDNFNMPAYTMTLDEAKDYVAAKLPGYTLKVQDRSYSPELLMKLKRCYY